MKRTTQPDKPRKRTRSRTKNKKTAQTGDKHKKRTLQTDKPAKRGPNSQCTDEVIDLAYKLCLVGLTNKELAKVLSVGESTIDYWHRNNPKFRQAVDKGRNLVDGEVADALRQRALGYSHQAVKIMKRTVKERDKEGNVIKEYQEPMKVEYEKKYPPNVKAAIKWLSTRHRKSWGNAHKVEHEHKHLHSANINIHKVLDVIRDNEKYSNEDLRRIAQEGLENEVKKIGNGEQ